VSARPSREARNGAEGNARRHASASRRLLIVLGVIGTLSLGALATGGTALTTIAAGASAKPRASLPNIQRQVMCVTCKIPLMVADSPQADRERAFIEALIAEGKDEAQIKDALVAQYGPAVLALPATHGFDLTVYLVPIAIVLALLAALAVLLPRWRRHARAQASERVPVPALSAAETSRLDADLERFD
jgi:cytochrome c-type biogenesis protein CcmH